MPLKKWRRIEIPELREQVRVVHSGRTLYLEAVPRQHPPTRFVGKLFRHVVTVLHEIGLFRWRPI
jgi:hypothetical protein